MMNKYKAFLILVICAFAILSIDCSTVKPVEEKKVVKDTLTRPVVDRIPPPKVMYNPDFIERMRIKDSKVISFDKVLFKIKKDKTEKVGKISTTTFNKEGVQLETVTFVKNKFEYRFAYKYDADGKKIETVRYNSKNVAEKKFTFEYDELGLRTKSRRYDSNQLLEKVYEYTYDNNWRLIEEKWFDAYSKLEYRIVIEYKAGRKEKAINYNSLGEPESTNEYVYDKNSNVIEEIRKDKNGKIEEKVQYVYKYRK